MIDRNYIARHDVIDRYLTGTLSEQELADFETRLVWDRDLGAEVDLAEHLRAGLRGVVEDGSISIDRTGGAANRAGRRFLTAGLPLAASFVVGVLATSVLVNVGQAPQSGIDPQIYAISTMPIEGVRGAGPSDVRQVAVRPDGLTVFLVEASMDYKSYRVSIRRSDATEPFMSRDGLVPGATAELEIGVPGSALKDGTYFLAVEGLSGERYEFIREYPFQAAVTD